jgi:hypothetical protein
VSASPAHSETIDLICASTDIPNSTYHIMIDTVGRTVTRIWPGGRTQYPATISDQYIKYSVPGEDNDHLSFEYTIDRIAGTMVQTEFFRGEDRHAPGYYACRRATQKF